MRNENEANGMEKGARQDILTRRAFPSRLKVHNRCCRCQHAALPRCSCWPSSQPSVQLSLNLVQVLVILTVRDGQLLLEDVLKVTRLPLQAPRARRAVDLHGVNIGRYTVHWVTVHGVPHSMVHPPTHTLSVRVRGEAARLSPGL